MEDRPVMGPPRTVTRIEGWRDVPLHVPEWGNPAGRPVVLVHGWSQSHLCWTRQIAEPLLDFRLIAPDLRGHGASAKPLGEDHYNHGAPWAGDLHAILGALGLEDAILVGWSMGGWVVQDYLGLHGAARLAGYMLVGSSAEVGRFCPPEAQSARASDADVAASGMYGEDLGENLDATRRFVRACFHQPPDADALAEMVGYNMLCPPAVRRGSRDRHEDYRPVLRKLTVPGCVLWGRFERLAVAPMPQRTVDAIPHVTALEYDQSGHAPFWEEPDRFNRDLADFVRKTA